MEYLFLLVSLSIILLAAELFTNGVEVFGENFSLSQAVVGSVVAAIGTALPETIIPLVAIIFYRGDLGSQIGVGAIIGAPFMLATLGMFMVAVGALISFFRKKRNFEIFLEINTFKRDFFFFLLSYSLAIGVSILYPSQKLLHFLTALLLVSLYLVYLFKTFRAESNEVEAHGELYLLRLLKKIVSSPSATVETFLSILQSVVAVLIMIKGAHLFVESLEGISLRLGISPLIFSLLITPVATELPEKLNSLLWSMRNRDILALGNISGAMVFQSTFPVSIGLIFTTWQIQGLALISALIAIILITLYFLFVLITSRLPLLLLLLSGFCYIMYVILVVISLRNA